MGSYFAKFWAMGSRWEKDCMLPIIWVSYGNKLSHTYAIAMQHFLDLPYLWELHGIWIRYYFVDYPY